MQKKHIGGSAASRDPRVPALKNIHWPAWHNVIYLYLPVQVYCTLIWNTLALQTWPKRLEFDREESTIWGPDRRTAQQAARPYRDHAAAMACWPWHQMHSKHHHQLGFCRDFQSFSIYHPSQREINRKHTSRYIHCWCLLALLQLQAPVGSCKILRCLSSYIFAHLNSSA